MRITGMVTDLKLLRLLQLVSPSLPIGMYSYSQGMERAVDDGWISSATDTQEWLSGILSTSLANIDLPILARMYDAWMQGDHPAIGYWSNTLIAYRETAELRAEDRQSGQALARLLDAMAYTDMHVWLRKPEATLATIFSFAAVQWDIPKRETAIGYVWSWLENQVLCAIKLVPLGQVAGQKLLLALTGVIPPLVEQALALTDEDIGGSAFALALASSRHEMQYSRLFRS